MSSTVVHGAFYRDELARAAEHGPLQRVLVSGSVDYGMLEILASAGGAALDYTVLDACATPLRICEWYAERHALSLATRRQEVLAPAPFAGFDFLCTHAFLGYFDEAGRRAVLAQWARWLRPGGRAVIVQPIREAVAAERVGFTGSEVEAFAACIATPVEAAGELPRDLASRARTYAENIAMQPVRSASALRESCAAAGFHLERFDCEPAVGPPGLSGPTVPTGQSFHLITAVKA